VQVDRVSYLRENIWIDTICINQAATDEKNDQVAQMGKVYSNARKVTMWLGETPAIHRRPNSALHTLHLLQRTLE
jgi:hypothetical protein